jgi:hypothetical protein
MQSIYWNDLDDLDDLDDLALLLHMMYQQATHRF